MTTNNPPLRTTHLRTSRHLITSKMPGTACAVNALTAIHATPTPLRVPAMHTMQLQHATNLLPYPLHVMTTCRGIPSPIELVSFACCVRNLT